VTGGGKIFIPAAAAVFGFIGVYLVWEDGIKYLISGKNS
jgi:hypothetical protein